MKGLILAGALFLLALSTQAQNGKEITGVWWNAEKKAKIEVYQQGNAFYGKIIWLKVTTNADGSTPRVDENNPDPKEAKKPLLGKVVLKNLKWEEALEYEGGSIYDPKSGKTYSCEAKLEGKTLYLRGYMGVSLIGKTSEWTRAE
jgi:uncharacterized protein (DUF2147 family)